MAAVAVRGAWRVSSLMGGLDKQQSYRDFSSQLIVVEIKNGFDRGQLTKLSLL